MDEISNMEDVDDFSIVREPIFTSVRSIGDYVTVMSQGTAEVKTLLADECDVILECKVCQSLFRSLPNFVAHKRVYCTRKFGGYLPSFPMHMTEDETVVLEPTDPEEDAESERANAEGGKARPLFESVLDGTFPGTSEAYKVFTDALIKEQTLSDDKDTTIVTLDTIPGNPNAMFQKVETYLGQDLSDDDITKIKSRKRAAQKNIEEVCSKIVRVEPKPASHSHVKVTLRQRKTDVDDENTKPCQSSPKEKSKCLRIGDWRRHCNLRSITCKLCNIRYASIKTLRFHVQSIHREARRFFPCLMCNAMFSQVWGVRRHMETIHHKSHEQWLKLCEVVKQKSFTVPLDQLDEHGKPKNCQKSKSKSLATKSKERAVANLKKAAAAKMSARTVTKHLVPSPSTDEEKEDSSQKAKPDTPNVRSSSQRNKSRTRKKEDLKKSSPGKERNASPGRILKVRITPAKIEQEKDDSSPGSTTSSQGGNKPYKCYNCGQTYELKGSLNKHLHRKRCFHPEQGPVSRTPERPAKETAHRREALASVLSPKQLKKVNSLMDRDNIRCLQCKKQFTALILLSRHVIRHLGIVRYKCKFCIYRSFNQGECMKHVRNSHKKNDAHKYVLNIDVDSGDTKCDSASRGLAAESVRSKCRVMSSSAVSKQLSRPKSPASCGSGTDTNSSSNTAVPTFNLSAAKRLFANTTSPKIGNEESKVNEDKSSVTSSPPSSRLELRPASVTRSNSVSSTCSEMKAGLDRKQPGIDSSNIKDPNTIKYNISTRNSPREFDTKPYKRVDTMAALQTRRGVYQKPKTKSQSSSESDEDGENEEDQEEAPEGRRMRSRDAPKSETTIRKGGKSHTADSGSAETGKKENGTD